MGDPNSRIAAEIKGMVNPLNFAALATPEARVQLLIDTLTYESTNPDEHRLYLDEMSPACRASLIVILTALGTEVVSGTQFVMTSGVEFLGPDKSGVYVNGWTPTIVAGVVTVMAAS